MDLSVPQIRLAELIGALSLATDFGMGQPLEFALRSCVVALRLAEKLGFDENGMRDVYYQSLLRYIGCNAETRLLAAVFGDELALRTEIIHTDPTTPAYFQLLTHFIRQANAGASPLQMLGAIVGGFAQMTSQVKEFFVGHCEVAARLAQRLELDHSTILAISQVYARWDGKGIPPLKGEAIAPGMLVVSLAQDAVAFYQLGGLEAAVAVAKQRRGGMYAPQHVEVFTQCAPELFAGLETDSVWEAVIRLEPGPRRYLTASQFDAACEAIADFTDIKSPYLLGHSTGVARLASGAARRSGLPEAEVSMLRRVGLLHDIGRVAVSAGIWGKPGSLSDPEWEKVRLHPYYTERILARPQALADLGAVASLHHERLDGSGYHRGLRTLPPAARLLAAADVYQALIEPRPYRPPRTPEQAADELNREVRAGRLDREAVHNVLLTAGHSVGRTRRDMVAGLSEREVEVLRLVARGLSIKEIAHQLIIAPKTVDNHIQHIYAKIGVTTRAGATLFAMENHLL